MSDCQDRYFNLPDQTRWLERVGSWALLGSEAAWIREAVFVKEQRVPPALEQDEFDASCLHIVICGPDPEKGWVAVATGRFVAQGSGEALSGPVARIGRLAVSKPFRGAGLGTRMLTTLMAQARLQGLNQFELHSRVDAMPLYRRFGFRPEGPAFDEAGTPHILMVRRDVSTDDRASR